MRDASFVVAHHALSCLSHTLRRRPMPKRSTGSWLRPLRCVCIYIYLYIIFIVITETHANTKARLAIRRQTHTRPVGENDTYMYIRRILDRFWFPTQQTKQMRSQNANDHKPAPPQRCRRSVFGQIRSMCGARAHMCRTAN